MDITSAYQVGRVQTVFLTRLLSSRENSIFKARSLVETVSSQKQALIVTFCLIVTNKGLYWLNGLATVLIQPSSGAPQVLARPRSKARRYIGVADAVGYKYLAQFYRSITVTRSEVNPS